MKFITALLAMLNVTVASARAIDVNVSDYGWLTSFPVLQDTLDFYLQGVEDDINADQPILNPSRFNYGTANSTVLASKGLGTDYVNDSEKYLVSLGLGVAWDDEKDVALKDEISGAGGASSVTVGKRLDQKVMGYINFGYFTHSRTIPTNDFDIAGDIEALNFGLHARYDLIERKNNSWWGGVKVHVGYEYSSNTVDLATDLNEPLTVDTGGLGTLEGTLTGRPTYTVETRTHSIPLEISSSVIFLNFLSFYGGVGADMNYGQSKGKGDIKGDVTTLACSSGICAGETVLPQLKAEANYDAVSDIRSVTLRGFAGLQIDLPFRLHAFGQAQKMLGHEIVGISAGMKYSF